MPFGQKDRRVRVVLDTNIVVSGFLWRSFPRQLLDLARANVITIYTGVALLDELADVLSRNKLAACVLRTPYSVLRTPGSGLVFCRKRGDLTPEF